MKKYLSTLCVLAVALLMMFSLSACAAKEQTATLETEQDGVVTTMTFDAKGDKVVKITQVATVDYEAAGLTEDDAVAYAEQSKAQIDEQIKDIDGASYEYTIDGSTLSDTFIFDTSTEAQVHQIIKSGILEIEEDAQYISFQQSVDQLQANGWTLK